MKSMMPEMTETILAYLKAHPDLAKKIAVGAK
jgi:2-oxo-4-hydroxy-4-carboxy--5-ureidoimidazoline (OHCU) decarboxylase